MSQHTVTLSGEIDLPGFRREARALLAGLVPPEDTQWHAEAGADWMTKSACTALTDARDTHAATNLFLPRSFLSLCDTVILHNDPTRFVLLYRLLWRLVHEPDLRRNPLDSDRMRALHMAQAVRRDIQKMKSLIRFKAMDEGAGAEPLHIAWFKPDHHIAEAVAPFFARRLAHLRWAILTPERSVRWNGEALEFGLGIRHQEMARDAIDADALLARYRQAFNPARPQCMARPQAQRPSDARSQ
ncbi:TIGR03915 family putative DNA repair protein [Variovorax sp. J22P240]|uniref:TIGR03915 family putative DNA repair protein n=1 Tax=Variovorax sp. J22P240 TaxID=3053514 RepID=UPI002578F701|nr:TIGR03915 family putative DNA repair protein [Variovorax sp. J22P240]MDL9999215.1 TIGR03915 family putative DNA repair protein [Variovorax sp. J22P240]